MFARTLTFALLFASAALPAIAGEVQVTGVHICCGACVKGVEKALKDVTGVSGVSADRESKTVRFTAADDKAATAGIEALSKAGFHGTAKHGEAALTFPASGAKEGAKAGQVKITNVHLCCPACVRAADEALKKVSGVSTVTADREASSIEVTGENVSVEDAVKALNEAGFHATIQP
jgi:periplasmic mercuric ion binding protein